MTEDCPIPLELLTDGATRKHGKEYEQGREKYEGIEEE
jgi:hypothetical protein